MKASDYIVSFLIDKGITDVFGYPGGSVTNLVDSLHKRKDRIRTHVAYHEQGAAFEACGYAQVSGTTGVAYATGGPGATNLITGIGHAYYDSIPIICFTGNVNTYESKKSENLRQKSFQESDIISVVSPLTKFCAQVHTVEELPGLLNKAYEIAISGRKGPVLLDVPMDIFRANLEPVTILSDATATEEKNCEIKNQFEEEVLKSLANCKRPCFILGNAIKVTRNQGHARSTFEKYKIPCVTSMIAFDVLGDSDYYYGFIGAYGHRTANIIMEKADLVVSIGSRLDIRQVGAKREAFAKNAKIIRVDIDEDELEYKVHKDEKGFRITIDDALNVLDNLPINNDYSEWIRTCNYIKDTLSGCDDRLPNLFIKELSHLIQEEAIVTTDVGQNQVWVAQSFNIKKNQEVQFCGGFGAMGYALPAAIGAYFGGDKKRGVVCVCGDGGLQMNIQELQFVVREQIPIKIIVINNYSLGMIRHFQEMYFEGKYYDTTYNGGYSVPDFSKIASAYGLDTCVVECIGDISMCKDVLKSTKPALIEVRINEDTYVFPKLEFGKPNYDQQPLLDRSLVKKLMEL